MKIDGHHRRFCSAVLVNSGECVMSYLWLFGKKIPLRLDAGSTKYIEVASNS